MPGARPRIVPWSTELVQAQPIVTGRAHRGASVAACDFEMTSGTRPFVQRFRRFTSGTVTSLMPICILSAHAKPQRGRRSDHQHDERPVVAATRVGPAEISCGCEAPGAPISTRHEPSGRVHLEGRTRCFWRAKDATDPVTENETTQD